MSSTLLAVLLVTASGKSTNLVFHWPPYPSSSPRLARPKPPFDENAPQVDKFWSYATNTVLDSDLHNPDGSTIYEDPILDQWDYEWKRPHTRQDRSRSQSFAESTGRSRPNSRRASPSKDAFDNDLADFNDEEAYNNVIGYPSSFLANVLCPKDGLCHQKFELIVDDLAFIGHPVCAEPGGKWNFKTERSQRGRGSRSAREQPPPVPEDPILTEKDKGDNSSDGVSPLQTFHLVLVIDLPDPSSSASGNLFKYFHVIYEQIAFTVTAVLFQEQVLNRYVDKESELLGTLKEACIKDMLPYADFFSRAIDNSSLARCLKTLFDSIKSNSIARLVINEIGVEVQLPPQLDKILDSTEEDPDYVQHEDPDEVSWGPELSFGWGLPTLAPWKSLLLLDLDEEHDDLKANLNRPGMAQEDQELAEELILFLETVSIFDSLAVVADSLNWDLERKVYPTVRWLVYHRKAKIVDTVHGSLRTVFALPSNMNPSALQELTEEFSKAFSQHVPPLYKILSAISNSNSADSPYSPLMSRSRDYIREERNVSTENHFFATVVKSKDLIPLYRDVVVWMLKRDLLVVLHLHVRIVASPAIKRRTVQLGRKNRLEEIRKRDGSVIDKGQIVRPLSSSHLHDHIAAQIDIANVFKPASSVPNYTRDRGRRFSSKSLGRGINQDAIQEEEGNEVMDDEDESDGSQNEWEDNELPPTIIYNPAQATKIQRKWIKAMSDGKDPVIAERFRQIHQYFDGKRTDDEILCKARISRKQLKEVLLHYEEHLLTFLHPG